MCIHKLYFCVYFLMIWLRATLMVGKYYGTVFIEF